MPKPLSHSQHLSPPDGIAIAGWKDIRGFRGGLTDALRFLMEAQAEDGKPLASREHLHKIRVSKGMPLAITMAANSLYTASCSSVRYAVVTERDPETGERVQVRKPVGYDLTPLRAAQEIADRVEGKAVQRVHLKTESIRNPSEVQAELVALLAQHPELASLVAAGLRAEPAPSLLPQAAGSVAVARGQAGGDPPNAG